MGFRVGACVIACVAIAGCYESHPGVSGARRDGGALDGANDLDAGPGQAADSAGPADAGVLACDQPIAPYEGLGCSAETRGCVAACADERCAQECVAADRECVRCIDQTLVACANQLGCEDEWFELACCAQAEPECATRSGVDLFACADACDEIDAYDACTSSIDATSCAEQVGSACLL